MQVSNTMNTVGISSNALCGNSANNFLEPFSWCKTFINIRSYLLIRLPFCICLCKTYVPYILAYKSQNLPQNLDLKVGGATYTRVIKWRIFSAAEIRNFRPRRATWQRPIHRRRVATAAAALSFLPVVHCRFTVAYVHGLLLIDRMASVTHQWSRRRHALLPTTRRVVCLDVGHPSRRHCKLKSSKATCDLYAGQWFWTTHGLDF